MLRYVLNLLRDLKNVTDITTLKSVERPFENNQM
jgi:hypothetical protein